MCTSLPYSTTLKTQTKKNTCNYHLDPDPKQNVFSVFSRVIRQIALAPCWATRLYTPHPITAGIKMRLQLTAFIYFYLVLTRFLCATLRSSTLCYHFFSLNLTTFHLAHRNERQQQLRKRHFRLWSRAVFMDSWLLHQAGGSYRVEDVVVFCLLYFCLIFCSASSSNTSPSVLSFYRHFARGVRGCIFAFPPVFSVVTLRPGPLFGNDLTHWITIRAGWYD